MSEPIVRLFDNPILIAQARRRLRRAQLVSSSLVFGLLGLCGLLLAAVAKDRVDAFSTLEYTLLIGIGLVFLLRGSNRIAEAVREERASGLLDFHRATPTTPWTDALGYLLGCPARDYLASGILAAFVLVSAPFSRFSATGIVGSLLILFVNGLLYHCFALWLGLTVSHKRGASGIIIGTLVALLLSSVSSQGLGAITYFTPYPAISALLASPEKSQVAVSFFGFPVHALLLSLLVQGSVLFGLSHAVARKIRHDESSSFSRLGTLYLFAWMAFLSLGAVWQFVVPSESVTHSTRDADVAIVVGYITLGTALAAGLVMGQVPSYLMLLRALRRARRQGTQVLSWLDEGGKTEPLTFGLWAFLIAGLFVISRAMGSKVKGPLVGEPVALAVMSVLLYLLFVQLACEFVRLKHRGSTHAVAVLVFFVSHVLPWLLGFVFGGADAQPGLLVMATSPLYSVGTSALNLAGHWFSEVAPTKSIETARLGIFVSMGVTLAACLFFFVESRRSQRTLAAQIAASGP